MNKAAKVPDIAKASVYLGYGGEDEGHVARLDDKLDRIKSAADQNAILVSAAATRLMYTAMCENITEVARLRRRAA